MAGTRDVVGYELGALSRMSFVVLLAVLLDGRALDTTKIPPHTIAVDDGMVLTPSGAFVAAVVGNLRGSTPTLDNGRAATKCA